MTRGGAAPGEDQEAPYGQVRVWPTQQKKASFYVHKEKEVFLDARHEFVDGNQASTSTVVANEGPILEMPQIFEQLFQKKQPEKVSKLKELFKSCLELITYKDAVAELSALIK